MELAGEAWNGLIACTKRFAERKKRRGARGDRSVRRGAAGRARGGGGARAARGGGAGAGLRRRRCGDETARRGPAGPARGCGGGRAQRGCAELRSGARAWFQQGKEYSRAGFQKFRS
jgi:hypothetical protein